MVLTTAGRQSPQWPSSERPALCQPSTAQAKTLPWAARAEPCCTCAPRGLRQNAVLGVPHDCSRTKQAQNLQALHTQWQLVKRLIIPPVKRLIDPLSSRPSIKSYKHAPHPHQCNHYYNVMQNETYMLTAENTSSTKMAMRKGFSTLSHCCQTPWPKL